MKWRKYALIRIKYVNVWKCERTNSPYRQMDIIHNVWWFAYLSVCCCKWSMRECRDHDLNWMRKFFRTKNKHVQQSIWLTPFQTKYKNHDDKNTDALSKHLFYCAIRFFSCLNGLYTIYICIRHTSEQYQSIVLQRILFQYLNALADATFGSYTFVSFTR